MVDGKVPQTTKVKESSQLTNLKMSPAKRSWCPDRSPKFSAGIGNKKGGQGQEPSGMCGVVGLVEAHPKAVEGARVTPCTGESARGHVDHQEQGRPRGKAHLSLGTCPSRNNCDHADQSPSSLMTQPNSLTEATCSRPRTSSQDCHLPHDNTQPPQHRLASSVTTVLKQCPSTFGLKLCGPRQTGKPTLAFHPTTDRADTDCDHTIQHNPASP